MAKVQGPAGAIGDLHRPPCGSASYAALTEDLELSPPARAIRCGGAGILHVTYTSGLEDSIPAVLAGEVIEGAFTKVFSDSTVTNITVFW